MQGTFFNKRVVALAVAAAGLLIGCGGGGGGGTASVAAPTLSGLAATGAGIANAAVTAKCATGAPLTGTTDANGSFNLVLGGRTLPCMLQVTGGTPAVTLHNAANGASVATITGNDNAQEPTIPKPKRTRRAAPVEASALVDVEAAHRRAAEVAERLRALRDAEAASGVSVGSRQWTIRPIAERAGMSGDPVAKLMRGEHVSPEMVDKLAAILPAE